jgi:hypothetical protein
MLIFPAGYLSPVALGAALREWLFGIVLLLLQTVAPLQAMAQVPKSIDQTSNSQDSICPMIEAAATANGLPIEFFARLIWQESRFKPDEVGPVTRSGERAQGIAQFMPSTAVERQLYKPFDPVEALPKSGQFLAELRGEFGNLGLAAAAYNAGPQRVRDFLAGTRDLPAETRNYVRVITGRPVEDWILTTEEPTPDGEHHADRETVNCRELVTLLERASGFSIRVWQGRIVPSWCRGLNHPNHSVCGPVHLIGHPTQLLRDAKLNSLRQGRVVPSWCKGLNHPNPDVCGPVHLVDGVTKFPIVKSKSHVHLVKAGTQ